MYAIGPCFTMAGSIQHRMLVGRSSSGPRRSLDTTSYAYCGDSVGSASVSGQNSNASPTRQRPSGALWASTTNVLGSTLRAFVQKSTGGMLLPWQTRGQTISASSTVTEALEATATISPAQQRREPASPTLQADRQQVVSAATSATTAPPSLDALQQQQQETLAALAPFLQPVDHLEVSYAALLSDLSNMAYESHLVSHEALLTKHGLHLVCTSSSPKHGPITREAWAKAVQEQRKSRSNSPVRPMPREAGQVPGSSPPCSPSNGSAAAALQITSAMASSAAGAGQEDSIASEDGIAHGLTLATMGGADPLHGLRSHRVSLPSAGGGAGGNGGGSPVLTPSISLISLTSLDESAANNSGGAGSGALASEDGASGAGAGSDHHHLLVPALTFMAAPASVTQEELIMTRTMMEEELDCMLQRTGSAASSTSGAFSSAPNSPRSTAGGAPASPRVTAAGSSGAPASPARQSTSMSGFGLVGPHSPSKRPGSFSGGAVPPPPQVVLPSPDVLDEVVAAATGSPRASFEGRAGTPSSPTHPSPAMPATSTADAALSATMVPPVSTRKGSVAIGPATTEEFLTASVDDILNADSGSASSPSHSAPEAPSTPVRASSALPRKRAGSVSRDESPRSPQAGAVSASIESPPAAWFAVDDSVTQTRYIVIQGSTNFDHWRINTQFEPVIFEDPKLGVRVHRGVYQAALQLYEDMVPLVRQHLASSPFASITLTGHSLGGSLATMLQLLFVVRGVLPPDCASPIYTFGAPAVFCGGSDPDMGPAPPGTSPQAAAQARCDACSLNCDAHDHRHISSSAAAAAVTPGAAAQQQQQRDRAEGPCPAPGQHYSAVQADFPHHQQQQHHHSSSVGLLRRLGLSDDHIVNVIMHRDIVPRAFVCDYTLVADLLKQWMPSFRDHSNLQGPAHAHKTLYNFLGRVAVLRPDPRSHFVLPSDAAHPHLPDTPGLYRMVPPRRHATPMSTTKSEHHRSMRVPSLDGSSSTSSSRSSSNDGQFSMVDTLMSHMGSHDELHLPSRHASLSHALPPSAAALAPPASSAPVASTSAAPPSGTTSKGSTKETSPGASSSAPKDGPPSTLRDAVLQFMNHPHPLTTLTEYGAYGTNGSISRYHNPDNYTKGLLKLTESVGAPSSTPPSLQQQQLVANNIVSATGSLRSSSPSPSPPPSSSSSSPSAYNSLTSMAAAATATLLSKGKGWVLPNPTQLASLLSLPTHSLLQRRTSTSSSSSPPPAAAGLVQAQVSLYSDAREDGIPEEESTSTEAEAQVAGQGGPTPELRRKSTPQHRHKPQGSMAGSKARVHGRSSHRPQHQHAPLHHSSQSHQGRQ